MADMKPCPHCGENCADIVINQGNKWAHYEAGCLEVRTGYDMKDNAEWREEAIKAWNARTYDTIINQQADEIKRLREDKDFAYQERNRLVALLARLYPSGRAVTDIEDWDKEWHNCIYIDTPAGQLSWHIHDNEMLQFASLPEYQKPWDGHSTNEKYRRVLKLILKAEDGKST